MNLISYKQFRLTYFLPVQFNIIRVQFTSSMEVLSNLLHGLSEAIHVVQQQVDQILERERRAEATRRTEVERERRPTPSSSVSEASRETAKTSDSETDTVQTPETSSDVTVRSSSRTDSDSTHVEPSRAQETTDGEQDMDPYEIVQLLEAMESRSSDVTPIGSDLISTRSARLRSPPSTGNENSSVAVRSAVEVEAPEWDVITARVAPSEENLLASNNSPALVANPIVPGVPACNDDIPTAIATDN